MTFEPFNGGAAYADIHLNASGFSWMTDLTCPTHDCGAYDVQNVVTHEVGHVVGLYHVNEEAQRLLAKRDLGAGDVLGLRRAYPLPELGC